MNIYATVAEDIDLAITGSISIITSSNFRSGWARCCFQASGGSSNLPGHSYPFIGGALTSAWLSCRFEYSSYSASNVPLIGFGLSGTNSALMIGCSSAGKTELMTISSGSIATIASEGGTSITTGGIIKFDMQVTSYGASATVNVYVNSTLVISFTGNVAVSGMTQFDHVYLFNGNVTGSSVACFSEIVVADSDTRGLLGLQTMALTGAGTTTQWTNNTYTNINGTSYSDSSPAYTNTTAKDQEYTVTAPTPSVFSVVAVTQSARAAIPSGSTPTHLKLGYGSSGTGHFGSGSTMSPGVGFTTSIQIDETNPITGVGWVQADLSGLQLDMQSD